MHTKSISRTQCPFSEVTHIAHSNEKTSIYYVDQHIVLNKKYLRDTTGLSHFPIRVGPLKGEDQKAAMLVPKAGETIAVPIKDGRGIGRWLKFEFMEVSKGYMCNHENEYNGFAKLVESIPPITWEGDRSFETIIPKHILP